MNLPSEAILLDYPREISDDEMIVRVVKTPYHLNKNRSRLTPSAFQPPRDSERGELSVIRWQYTFTDPQALKAKVVEIGGEAYAGVAHLPCQKVRQAPADIEDSRHWFQGHADIILGVEIPLQEPAEGEEGTRLKEVRKALSDAATYLADPEPKSPDWTIAELDPPPANG